MNQKRASLFFSYSVKNTFLAFPLGEYWVNGSCHCNLQDKYGYGTHVLSYGRIELTVDSYIISIGLEISLSNARGVKFVVTVFLNSLLRNIIYWISREKA